MCDVTKGNQNDGYEVAYCQDKECFIPQDDERNSVVRQGMATRTPKGVLGKKAEGAWWEWGCCLFTGGYTGTRKMSRQVSLSMRSAGTVEGRQAALNVERAMTDACPL